MVLGLVNYIIILEFSYQFISKPNQFHLQLNQVAEQLSL